MSRLENLKMNAELLICFIDFLRTSLEQFSDWLIHSTSLHMPQSNSISSPSMYKYITLLYIFASTLSPYLRRLTPWDWMTVDCVSLASATGQDSVVSGPSCPSSPSGGRLLRTWEQSVLTEILWWRWGVKLYRSWRRNVIILSIACWQ